MISIRCTASAHHIYVDILKVSANHNNRRLLCLLPVTLKVIVANNVDPESDLVHTVCLYAKIGLKNLQEYSADDINRRYFQMQVLRVNIENFTIKVVLLNVIYRIPVTA